MDLAQTQAGSGIALATTDGVEHGLKKGDRVLVEPDEGFPTFAGIFVVLDVLTAHTFTYRVPPGPGTAHGAGAIYKVMASGGSWWRATR